MTALKIKQYVYYRGKSERVSPNQPNSNMQTNTNCSFKIQKGNKTFSIGQKDEDDKAFYKKYPNIKYEEGQYFILSSDQFSSSDEDESNDEDDFSQYDNENPSAKYEDEEMN